jgi:hypothetical protein
MVTERKGSFICKTCFAEDMCDNPTPRGTHDAIIHLPGPQKGKKTINEPGLGREKGKERSQG